MPTVHPFSESVLSEELFCTQLLLALQETWLFFTFEAISIINMGLGPILLMHGTDITLLQLLGLHRVFAPDLQKS